MDGTENFEKKIVDEESLSYSGTVGDSDFVPLEEVEIRKPNRHERRRRAKLARMQEARDKAEAERLKDKNRKEKGK